MSTKYMRLFLLTILAFSLIFSGHFSQVRAQTTEENPLLQQAQTWLCLSDPDNQQINPNPEVNLNLQGKNFPVSTDVYIVMCTTAENPDVSSGISYACTTGDSSNDIALFEEDTRNTILPSTFTVANGSKIVTSSSNVAVSTTIRNISEGRLLFFGVFHSAQPGVNPDYERSTIQYDKLNFAPPVQDNEECSGTSVAVPPPARGSAGFRSMMERWDPFGRLFDSQSLEPMANVTVTLLDENKKVVSLPGLRNPQPTKTNGLFNFLVGKGTYYLQIAPPVTHTFTASPKLNTSYSKIYSTIYKPDDQIVEINGPEERDVPLDPGTNTPLRVDVIEMKFLPPLRLGSQIQYEGKVSHALTTVKLIGENTGKEYFKTTASKYGTWLLLVDGTKVPQDENLKPQYTKNAISTVSKTPNPGVIGWIKKVIVKLLVKEATAQTKKSTAPPIFSYIEGYAYDKQGEIIPNAKVGIRLNMSKKDYYQIIADEQGFFSIRTQHLPIMPYHLIFTSPTTNKSTTVTTVEFAQQNKEYLNNKKINLVAGTKEGVAVAAIYDLEKEKSNPEAGSKQINELVQERNQALYQASANASVPGNNILLLVATVVLIIIAIVAVALYIRSKKKKMGGNIEPPPSLPTT